MHFIYTYQHGVEPILFRNRAAAQAEAARLAEWAAYRGLDIIVAEIDFSHGGGQITDGAVFGLESIL